MATRVDYSSDTGYDFKTNYWIPEFICGQTFTASDNYTISSVILRLKRISTPGILTIGIYATSGGLPTGDVLSSGTTDGDTLSTTTYENREVSLTGYNIVSGTKYAITIDQASDVNGHGIKWNGTSTNSYSGGTMIHNASGSWTIYSSYDMWFATYTEDTEYVDISGTITGTSSMSGTLGMAAKNPDPANAYSGMGLDWQTFSWESGSAVPPDDEVYNVYFGTDVDNLSLILLEGPDINFAAAYLAVVAGMGGYSSTYYWRVDTYFQNSETTIQGDVWSFSTITFDFPPGGARGIGEGYGGGSGEAEGYGGGTFGDKQIGIKTRLVEFARNTLYYENL